MKLKRFFQSDFGFSVLLYSFFFMTFGRADLIFGIWKTPDIATSIPPVDELGYMGRLESYLNFVFKPFDNTFRSINNFYAPGTSIAWLPGGVLSKVISPTLTGDPLHSHWAFMAAYSSLFWILIYFLTIKICEELKFIPVRVADQPRERSSHAFVLAIVICFQILHYSFHRVLMSHGVELTFSLLTLYFATKNRLSLALVFAGFLAITRFNDAPVFLVVFGRYLDTKREPISLRSTLLLVRRHYILSFSTLAVITWVLRTAFITGYSKFRFFDLLIGLKPWDFLYFFMAPDWGVFWLLPVWMVGFILGCIHVKTLSNASRAALLWFALEMFLCVGWRSNGSDFGQRYLIGSCPALLLVWAELLTLMKPVVERRFKTLLRINAAWLCVLTIVFFTLPTTYVENEIFMIDAFKVLFHREFWERAFQLSTFGSVSIYLMHGMSDLLPLLERPRSFVSEVGWKFCYSYFLICSGIVSLYFVSRFKDQKPKN